MSLPNHSVIPAGDLLTLHLLLTPHGASHINFLFNPSVLS